MTSSLCFILGNGSRPEEILYKIWWVNGDNLRKKLHLNFPARSPICKSLSGTVHQPDPAADEGRPDETVLLPRRSAAVHRRRGIGDHRRERLHGEPCWKSSLRRNVTWKYAYSKILQTPPEGGGTHWRIILCHLHNLFIHLHYINQGFIYYKNYILKHDEIRKTSKHPKGMRCISRVWISEMLRFCTLIGNREVLKVAANKIWSN